MWLSDKDRDEDAQDAAPVVPTACYTAHRSAVVRMQDVLGLEQMYTNHRERNVVHSRVVLGCTQLSGKRKKQHARPSNYYVFNATASSEKGIEFEL